MSTVRWSRSVDPVSHETQPGRLITTVIDTRSCAEILPIGRIVGSPLRFTGITPPCALVTLMLCTLPPPRGIVMRASALLSAVRVGLEDLSAIAAAASTAITITARPAA